MRTFGRKGAVLALFLLAATATVAGRTVHGGPGPAAPAAEGEKGWIDFTLPDANGSRVSLSRYIGKKAVLLVFWATWCPHCNESVPLINRMHTEAPGRDKLQILALDFMESREKASAFIHRKQVKYPVLLDKNGSVARTYRVVGIPTYILIDRHGKVVYRDHEIPEIDRYLE